MANNEIIVSNIKRFEPALDRAAGEILNVKSVISIELENGRIARIDPRHSHAADYIEILEGLSKLNRPVYLEVQAKTSLITRLLIPHLTRAISVRPLDDQRLIVEIELSHARHVLQRGQAGFAEMEKLLIEAIQNKKPIVLTEDDAHNIIDIRFFELGKDAVAPSFPFMLAPYRLPRLNVISDLIYRIWIWPWWPWWWFCCLSLAKAQQVFDAMKNTSCNPVTVPPPCIPFLYPDDGCWGRAHEMCRLMINQGLSPKKVWIQGNLHVQTKNNPNCQVWWGWHVAPTLCVRGSSLFQTHTMVIDPSLFDTPVTKATWKNKQGDVNASLTDSDASIFYLWSGETDPSYVKTNQVLATYRLQLKNRSIQFGPPPYANCP